MEFLQTIEFWHWWVAAVALIIVEALAPGAVFLWLGVSAGVVGAILLAAPGLSWEIQVMIFAVLSVGSVFGWRVYQKSHPTETDLPTLNRRGEQYIGRIITLDKAIVNRVGKVRLDDTSWKVEGGDLPAGTTVKVVGIDGVVLKVEEEA
ncbi:MAG: NfeD family protein [Proteobacteria bacterium]|nr:NfeD family protein [Pseudomonadota bacterium]